MATEKRLIEAMNTVTKISKRVSALIQCGANSTEVYNVVLDTIAEAPTVDAVEVNKLGELGRLMMPYKGCPRGRIGAAGTVGLSGCVDADLHITELNLIEDVDGNLWVPVLADDLRRLKARQVGAVEVVHSRWVKDSDGDEYCEICSRYMPIWESSGNPSEHNYCPNCGAKMDGDGNA